MHAGQHQRSRPNIRTNPPAQPTVRLRHSRLQHSIGRIILPPQDVFMS
jgi:hypothetical protein